MVEGVLDPADPATPFIAFGLWAFGVFVALFLLCLVIRLAFAHGMLADTRALDEERGTTRYRD